MTTLHACVFLALGGMLNLLPSIAPGHFPPATFNSANTSALWLQFMSWISAGLGAGFVVRLLALPALARALAWRPAPLPDFSAAEILRPVLALDHGDYADSEREQGMAA